MIPLYFELLPFISFYLEMFTFNVCLGHPGRNFQTIKAINLKRQSLIAHIGEKCNAQEL